MLVALYIFINTYGIICVVRNIENVKITDKNSSYYCSSMSEGLYKDLNEITEYIKMKNDEGIEVYILSQNAPLYMIALKQNHGEFDLPFRGNLGYNGEEKLINKIGNLENTQILLSSNIYWQEVREVRAYVISNFNKVGLIGEYTIYNK